MRKLFFFVARIVVILVLYIYMLNAARRLNGSRAVWFLSF
jgi:hypothetical protein